MVGRTAEATGQLPLLADHSRGFCFLRDPPKPRTETKVLRTRSFVTFRWTTYSNGNLDKGLMCSVFLCVPDSAKQESQVSPGVEEADKPRTYSKTSFPLSVKKTLRNGFWSWNLSVVLHRTPRTNSRLIDSSLPNTASWYTRSLIRISLIRIRQTRILSVTVLWWILT